jgi:hypothetical protein
MEELQTLCNRALNLLREAEELLDALADCESEEDRVKRAGDLRAVAEVIEDLLVLLGGLLDDPHVGRQARRLSAWLDRAATYILAASVKANPKISLGDIAELAWEKADWARDVVLDVLGVPDAA